MTASAAPVQGDRHRQETTYTYPLAGSMLPHAVSVVAGTINSTFTYDPNGNQTAGLGRSISYTSYNKPSSITQGSATLFFADDVDHQRFRQQAPEGTTFYFNAFGVHAELFASGTSQWYDYVSAGGAMLGMRVLHLDLSVTTRYFHTDNLGSIAVITDETGAVAERDGYDAWGKRRFPNGADDPTGSLTSQTTRGFTAQEELHDVGLVHLNGRVYDPLVARMMSADPIVDDPMNGQTWNRYSYVGNNPLTFTDPSGYCFLGCGTWSNLGKMQLGTTFRQHPLLGSIVEIAATGICTLMTAGGCVPSVVAVLASATVAGITSGRLGKDVLRAGLVAQATSSAFAVVGGITSAMPGAIPGADGSDGTFVPFSEGHLANIAGHALVGCGQFVASGGKCGAGALAGAVTSTAGPYIYNLGFGSKLIANAALGGAGAVLGGGKFANGAITGAFGYLFNECAQGGCGGGSDGSGFWGLLGGNHDYTAGPNVICPASWNCSDELVGSVYSQVRNGVPGNISDALIVSGQTYTVYQSGVPVGQARSYVGEGGLTVVNITNLDHILFDVMGESKCLSGKWHLVFVYAWLWDELLRRSVYGGSKPSVWARHLQQYGQIDSCAALRLHAPLTAHR
jgi:RHS repeat-associated protein